MLNFRTFIPLLLATTLTIFGCKDSGSNSDNGSDYNGLAIQVVNTDTGDLELSQDSEAATVFCYEEDGCETAGGFSFHTINEGRENITDSSHPEGQVVGVKVAFHVDEGSGYFEIVNGEAYLDDPGFLEFNPEEVVYTSDEFSAGTTISYSYGETN